MIPLLLEMEKQFTELSLGASKLLKRAQHFSEQSFQFEAQHAKNIIGGAQFDGLRFLDTILYYTIFSILNQSHFFPTCLVY